MKTRVELGLLEILCFVRIGISTVLPGLTSNISSPTWAVPKPDVINQCSALNWWLCNERRLPGKISIRFTWQSVPVKRIVYLPHGRASVVTDGF